MTVFVNRDNDVVQVKRMLSSARLVTLAGVGGAGKTRLAIRVAADIGSTYRDGAWLVDAPEEQAVWARLSIFHGGFPAEAARYVCAPELPETTVVDVLSGLLDQSVLSRVDGSGPARYRLLETVRRYGEDRLRAERDPAPADLARRHRDWYLELARRFERDWFGPRETDWLQQLGQEQGNLRAALDFSLSVPGEAAVGQDLAGCLAGFWYATGRLHEGRYWLRRVLETDARPSRERAHALAGASLVEQAMGDR